MSSDNTFSMLTPFTSKHRPLKPGIGLNFLMLCQLIQVVLIFSKQFSVGVPLQGKYTWCYYFGPTRERRDLEARWPCLHLIDWRFIQPTSTKHRIYWTKKSVIGTMPAATFHSAKLQGLFVPCGSPKILKFIRASLRCSPFECLVLGPFCL